MKKNAMRTIAIWMVLALCLALVPMQAYAEEAAAEEQETVQAAEPRHLMITDRIPIRKHPLRQRVQVQLTANG